MATTPAVPTSSTPIGPAEYSAALGAGIFGSEIGSAWFGVGQPLNPIAPTQVAGRQLDYQFAFNKQWQPKAADGSSVRFDQLRALSEGWEILRLIIETRKDRGSVVPVTFRDRGAKKSDKPSSSVARAVSLFRKPDGIHGLTAWRRMIREDLYVLDAPTVYMDRDRRGNVIGFDIIDGATIKVVPDNWGRLPREGTAFQQVLKGVPAVDYDARDIVYAPRNPRPHKFYGFSPVEQIVVYIDTYIRRMLGQRNHFTEGNIPEMLIACPETWQPAQVKEMQEFWDELLSGNLKARAGARFIPGGMKPIPTKGDELIKSDFDEWGARIACYAFSESPTPFVRDTNRATAETANSSAVRDGTLSELAWEKDLFDELLDRAGLGDVEAIFDTTVTPDPKTKSEMVLAHFAGGLISGTTAREELGYTEQDAPERKPAATDPATKDGAKACGHDHEARKADAMPPSDAELEMQAAAQIALDALADKADAAAQAIYAGKKVPEVELSKTQAKAFAATSRVILAENAVAGLSIAKSMAREQIDTKMLESPARAWAAERGAWLVGMKIEVGEGGKPRLVPNPDAKYRISDECREAVRSTIAKAFETRMSPQQLSDAIRTHGAFSTTRSLAIARTEIAEAQEAGGMVYMKAAGVPKKKWSGPADCCGLCQSNVEAGAIGIEEEFPSGHQHGPAHPNDRCRVIPAYDEATP